MSSLSHPNIVKIYNFYIDKVKKKVYLVNELISGKSLFKLKKDKFQMTENEIRSAFI